MKARSQGSSVQRILSGYWRVDQSSDRSRELASVLGGVASQADLVQAALRGRDDEAPSHYAPIVLDPTLLNGFAAPFPPVVVDCLTGLAVREAALRTLSMDSSELPGWDEMSPEERRGFRKVHRTLEDAYVFRRLDHVSPTLEAYVSTMRAMMEPLELSRGRSVIDVRLTRESVLETWLLADRGYETGSTDRRALLEAVRTLDLRLPGYWSEDDPRVRLTIAEGVWRWLMGFPSDPATRLLESFWHDAQEWQEDRDARAARLQLRKNVLGGGETGSLTDLSAFLLEQVTSAPKEITGGSDDTGGSNGVAITDELRDLGIRAAATHIKDARYDADDHERVAAQVTDEIESVRHLFARLDAVNSRWRHGLNRGKVDGARLTKAAAGKTSVFKLRDRQERRSMALVFLIDVSASMRSYMPVVNRSACVLSEALRG
ncbi:hypothetical protein ACFLUT_02680, partial [Chloroflexota bacterium]